MRWIAVRAVQSSPKIRRTRRKPPGLKRLQVDSCKWWLAIPTEVGCGHPHHFDSDSGQSHSKASATRPMWFKHIPSCGHCHLNKDFGPALLKLPSEHGMHDSGSLPSLDCLVCALCVPCSSIIANLHPDAYVLHRFAMHLCFHISGEVSDRTSAPAPPAPSSSYAIIQQSLITPRPQLEVSL